MPRAARACFTLLLLTACSPAPPSATSATAGPKTDSASGASAVSLARPLSPEELVFPAPHEHEPRQRTKLELGGTPQTSLQVTSPYSDQFWVEGRTLNFGFNQPVQGAVPGATAGQVLELTPPAAGQTRWIDEQTLEFVAAEPFDPSVSHQVRLHKLRANPRSPEFSWRGTFTAAGPRIAGKELGYLPVAGDARVVALSVGDQAHVSKRARVMVLYDQPVSPAFARRSVELSLPDGTLLPVRREVLGAGDFNGTGAPQGHRVRLEVLQELPHGTQLSLSARDATPSPQRPGMEASISVAPKFAFTQAICPNTGEACDRRGDTLLMDGRQLELLFNNSISENSSELARRVRVSPSIRNFAVYTYDSYRGGELLVSGDFRPNTSYSVTIGGLTDRYGNGLSKPVNLRAVQRPLEASLSMAGGSLWLDADAAQSFQFDARNVDRAQLWLWRVDAQSTALALNAPDIVAQQAPFTVLPVDVRPRLDEIVTTTVDLSRALIQGQSYVIQLRHDETAFNAKPPAYPEDSPASTPPTAFVTLAGKGALAVHVHRAPGSALVHVSEASSGKPVPHARVRLGIDSKAPWTNTDTGGIARLSTTGSDVDSILEVRAGDQRLLVPAQEQQKTAANLFPELAHVDENSNLAPVLVHTDRDIYRPGETLHFKVSAFARGGAGLEPRANEKLTLLLKGPDGSELFEKALTTNRFGSVEQDFPLPDAAKLGSYNLSVLAKQLTLATQTVRVAAFDPPKFVVDLQAPRNIATHEFRASISGRYLFGAPLAGAPLSWSLSVKPTAVPTGPLARAGLGFEDDWAEQSGSVTGTQTGSAALDANGDHELTITLAGGRPAIPVAVTLQAEVSDASHRSAAARQEIVVHPAQRYAGLKLARPWYGEKDGIAVELGVVDTKGSPLGGLPVRAELERISYVEVKERNKDGSVHYRWDEKRQSVQSCSSVSAPNPVPCSLAPVSSGYYRVSASVDGRTGGSRHLWITGSSETNTDPGPRKSDKLNLIPDKPEYQPGETARILVENPWPSATALVTLESDRLVSHQVVTLNRRLATIDIPLEGRLAPFAHATVTLLPLGLGANTRAPLLGALRLPVALGDARLDVSVASDKAEYRPRDTATLTVDVAGKSAREGNVEVALAVVDEGVLRLTGFHIPDPLERLWTGFPLRFGYADTRSNFAAWLHRSHVAGDGGDEASQQPLLTRQNFVNTALWKPRLVTDAEGRARVSFQLPDNLTEFRMLAVAIDRQGRAGTREASFRVTEPVLIQPAMPRFALQGDRFEAAAMLHNTTAVPFQGSLELAGKAQRVTLPAQGRVRVGQMMTASTAGSRAIDFTLKDSSGKAVDSVRHTLDVGLPGVAERPRLIGSFAGKQSVVVRIPEAALAESGATLEVTVGTNLHPELGQELEFLLDYPHGCVEQTTSSTLPLLAARQILPLLGLTSHNQAFFDTRIEHGLKRLATMRTPEGGLAYWPGEDEPNVFGTAYAMRAVVASRKLGIRLPEGLDAAMLDYLRQQLSNTSVVPEVRSAIALSLAESERLTTTDTDALFDLAKSLGVFGKSNLALALERLGGQSERVAKLTDDVERVLREDGDLGPKNREDMHSFDSDTRALAQASLALFHLKPASQELPGTVNHLLLLQEGYTTQATAYRLLALAEHVKAQAEGTPSVVTLDGAPLTPKGKFSGSGRVYRIPLSELKGRERRLAFSGDPKQHVSFSVSANYALPYDNASARAQPGASSGEQGPDLYRVFTTPEGAPVNLSQVQAGQVLRVALLALQPDSKLNKFRYLAITDALPAGFEAVDTSLETVAQAGTVGAEHPFERWLRNSPAPDHLELGTDRVKVYFDAPENTSVAVSYLVRATTPGSFVLPRASAELMYEPYSTSFSDSGRVTVQ